MATTTPPQLSYVLVTPARNEGALIERTIRSVVGQTVLPRNWIIVSDGSTDNTDEIVRRYAKQYDWIELVRRPERRERDFAGKAAAFNAGYSRLAALRSHALTSWEFIANLDADITFEPDYFEFLLQKFSGNPRLGVAGTPFVEHHDQLDQHSYAHQFANSVHVSGACQMFRRQCFEEVGGYAPLKTGAIDWVAVTTARMKGWETRTFNEKVCFHHRQLGVGSGSPGKLPTSFHYGRKAYLVGGHPLWECSRGLFRMRERPFIIGGLCFIAGYTCAALGRRQRAVSQELIRFHRAEQIGRLRRVLTRVVSRNSKRLGLQPPSSNDRRSNTRGSSLAHSLVISRHGLVRLAAIYDEEWIEGEPVTNPEAFIRCLRETPPADIFSFARSLPVCEPRYPFHFDWDNVAALRTADFADWWDSLPQETRKNVRRSQRRGVEVRSVGFSDELIHGISKMYNETPIRQGRKFWHYGKSFEEVKAANGTYLDRSEFIGAFVDGELIGFIKFVVTNNVARVMQILSLEAHADKRPTNALLSKAVEICCKRNISHLIYGKYVYGKKETSSVTEFKRRNGFERLDFPRYYVPLTRRGSLAIRYGLYREITEVVPEAVFNLFLATRAAIYSYRFNRSRNSSPKASLQRSSNQI